MVPAHATRQLEGKIIQVPDDVWHAIAVYIDDKELKSLYTVNRFFFHRAMDLRYGEVCITSLTSHSMRLLEHLKNDHIARRVLRLTLCPHFAVPQGRDQQNRLNLRGLLRASRNIFSGNSHKAIKSPVVQDLDLILDKMLNVEEYTLRWDGITLVDYPPSQELTPYPRVWSTWTNLRKLKLVTNREWLPLLLQSAESLQCLREFDLTLPVLPRPLDSLNWDPTCQSELPVFLNRFDQQLESLSLQTDYASLFGELIHFPLLKKLSLRASLGQGHLSSALEVNRFLGLHVEHLEELKLHQIHCPGSCCSSQGTDQSTALHSIFQERAFVNLTSLEVWLRPNENTAPLVGLIKGASHSIRRLTISSTALNADEFEAVIGALGGPNLSLRFLTIRIALLNKAVLDLLAERLPSLTSLTIVIWPPNGDMPNVDSYERLAFSLAQLKVNYSDWKLYDITVYTRGENGPATYNLMLMKAIARHTPSIRSFNGQGSMEPPVARVDS
ncbi:hypothetical protein HGRIS_003870 [Hohenbuehelia grisea]|uniref:F-box domain-containing protein n=1 Tax=Hohenbuehelia grisea TaxID=104357 RepID=A0ABR3JHE1_9AGAR